MRLIAAMFAACLCMSAYAEDLEPEKHVYPENKIFPWVNFNEPYIVNPGAKTEIIIYPDQLYLTYEFFGTDHGGILGVFVYPEGGPDKIFIAGPVTPSAFVLLHEYQHLIELRMPGHERELRDVFNELVTPQFRIGYADLEGEAGLPPLAPPEFDGDDHSPEPSLEN